MGTETEPNCMDKFCWYMNLPAGTITKETLEKLKVDKVEFNNRATGLGGSSIYKMKYDGLFYTEPTDPDAGPAADELWDIVQLHLHCTEPTSEAYLGRTLEEAQIITTISNIKWQRIEKTLTLHSFKIYFIS